MTINMGGIHKGPVPAESLNQEAGLTVVSLAADNKVMAVGVTTSIPSSNKQKHITLAVNRNAGGKPFHSNKLADWEPISEPFELSGVILEVG